MINVPVVVPRGRTRSNGHTPEHRKFNLNMKKILFPVKVLERAAQTGGGVFFSEEILNPPGGDPEQPCSG